ncbi:MAG: c-type cytochrome [Rhodospirillales bacterium]|jgi:cytochrome c|nr:c-type cytochrome [Rhodospirillales bacterium]
MFRASSIALGALCAVFLAGGQAVAADAAKGEATFKKRCVACHTIEEGKNKVGPSLHAIVGRTAGTVEGYKYSDSYIEAGKAGLIWTEDKIVPYLEDPKGYMAEVTRDPKAKSKMVFKLKSEADRKDIAAYLTTVK